MSILFHERVFVSPLVLLWYYWQVQPAIKWFEHTIDMFGTLTSSVNSCSLTNVPPRIRKGAVRVRYNQNLIPSPGYRHNRVRRCWLCCCTRKKCRDRIPRRRWAIDESTLRCVGEVLLCVRWVMVRVVMLWVQVEWYGFSVLLEETISLSAVAYTFLASSKAEAPRRSNSSIYCSLRNERADDSSCSIKDQPVRSAFRQFKQKTRGTACLF